MALVLVTARFVGLDPVRPGHRDRCCAGCAGWPGWAGSVCSSCWPAGRRSGRSVFNTASPWPFVVLAVGSAVPPRRWPSAAAPCRAGWTSAGWPLSLLTEMGVRVVGRSTAVLLGGGVIGATAGLSCVADGHLGPGPDADRGRERRHRGRRCRPRCGRTCGRSPCCWPPRSCCPTSTSWSPRPSCPAIRPGAYSAIALIGRGRVLPVLGGGHRACSRRSPDGTPAAGRPDRCCAAALLAVGTARAGLRRRRAAARRAGPGRRPRTRPTAGWPRSWRCTPWSPRRSRWPT